MPVIPATWEIEIGGSWSDDSLGESMIPYQNKLKQKTLKHGVSSTALA
jgi:hypothetical protein